VDTGERGHESWVALEEDETSGVAGGGGGVVRVKGWERRHICCCQGQSVVEEYGEWFEI
jgi:hypothetical protein